MKQLIPLHDNLLLEPMEPIDKIGMIHLPEAHKIVVNQGKVIELGPNCQKLIQIGDVVFFPLHSEHKIGLDGKKFIFVSEANCVGIIRDMKK